MAVFSATRYTQVGTEDSPRNASTERQTCSAISWSRKELRHHDKIKHAFDVDQAALRPNDSEIDPRLDWLYDQIRQLNELDRSLTLLLLDGFSYKEMADALGMSETNVGVRIHRIKAHLTAQSTQESEHAT